MIESIEGKRGEPRMRPPYIAQVGLFGRPTLEHNFETLYWVRDIFERGPAWFSSFGRNGRKGLRSFSVSGRVKSPGVKLAPAGIRVNCIAPGPTDTPIHATWADDLDEAYRWLKSQVPLGRIGDPADVARWIALLLSPVSSFMTGAVIPLDGGQVIPHA
jgi:hypothetical protein